MNCFVCIMKNTTEGGRKLQKNFKEEIVEPVMIGEDCFSLKLNPIIKFCNSEIYCSIYIQMA